MRWRSTSRHATAAADSAGGALAAVLSCAAYPSMDAFVDDQHTCAHVDAAAYASRLWRATARGNALQQTRWLRARRPAVVLTAAREADA
jgi:hypothetical protein